MWGKAKGGVKNDIHRFADSRAAGGAFTELNSREVDFEEKGEILLFLFAFYWMLYLTLSFWLGISLTFK